MEKPEEGFQSLNKKLTNEGLMKLGFYSKFAKKRLTNIKILLEKII